MSVKKGDRVRLAEDAAPCKAGYEGTVDDILENGDLVVVADKDVNCETVGPFVCIVTAWEPAKC